MTLRSPTEAGWVIFLSMSSTCALTLHELLNTLYRIVSKGGNLMGEVGYGGYNSVGAILVLFILLVIITASFWV